MRSCFSKTRCCITGLREKQDVEYLAAFPAAERDADPSDRLRQPRQVKFALNSQTE
jgi:hypothetical protein